MFESNGQTFKSFALEQQEDGRLEEQSEQQRLRSEYNQTFPIKRLPFEVLKIILNELTFNDLLACERVCQCWNDCVRELNIRRTIIAKVPPVAYKSRKIRPRKWFFIETNDWSPSNELSRSDLEINLNDSFLLNLRQLRVCDPAIKHLSTALDRPLLKNADFINQLIHLEVLEISRIDEGTIDLPNLKCLAIHRLSSNVQIDCPKLTSFRTKETAHLKLPEFLQPQTITHLYTTVFLPDFVVFDSLEYLSLESFAFYEGYHRHDRFLAAFPNLRVLSQVPGKFGDCANEESLEKILARKIELNRHNLRIIYFGVPIDKPAQLKESNALRLLMRNYEKRWPEELKLVTSISYPELMSSVDHKPEQLPDDIQRTFCNVQRVTVGELQDEDALLRFLVGLQKLRIVYFVTSSWLSEPFFERLAVACPPSSHKCLELCFNEFLVSFEFIFKFDNLVCLKLFGGVLQNQFIRRLFDKFGTFELFFYDRGYVCISRRYRLSRFDYSYLGNCKSFDSLDDLLQAHANRIKAN